MTTRRGAVISSWMVSWSRYALDEDAFLPQTLDLEMPFDRLDRGPVEVAAAGQPVRRWGEQALEAHHMRTL